MAGNASRINGQKGGRPKGSENSDTQQRREMKKRWIERVHGVADKIFDAHLDLALGAHTEKETPEGLIRVYKRSPDARSLQWIMEQVWGKADVPGNANDTDGERENDDLPEETQKSLEWAVRCAFPSSEYNSKMKRTARLS